jgi:hypothetical protein
MHGSININPLNVKLNPICHLLALLGAHHFLHVSGVKVKSIYPLLVHYFFRYHHYIQSGPKNIYTIYSSISLE